MYVRLSFGSGFLVRVSRTLPRRARARAWCPLRIFHNRFSARAASCIVTAVTVTQGTTTTRPHKTGTGTGLIPALPSAVADHIFICIGTVLHMRCFVSAVADLLLAVTLLQATACCRTCVFAVMFCVYVVECGGLPAYTRFRCVEVRLDEMRPIFYTVPSVNTTSNHDTEHPCTAHVGR